MGRSLNDFTGWLPEPLAADLTARERAHHRPGRYPAVHPVTSDDQLAMLEVTDITSAADGDLPDFATRLTLWRKR
ncbi:hypothetical protein ACF1GT_01625 [Streptomyces sp. NPDC014636]|uniref:hypothetical protein n=1 Tax=Streptomyces sp. NPDC014636 TaxID=3364876 RepID=UPI003701DB3B